MIEKMPMIPLRGLVVFPNMVIHFDVGREKSILALEKAMMLDQRIFLVSQKDPETALPTAEDVFDVGTIVKVKQMLKMPGGTVRVLVDGVSRANIIEICQENPFFAADITEYEDPEVNINKPDIAALMRTALALFEEYINGHQSNRKNDILSGMNQIIEPGRMADIMAANMDLKIDETQSVLANADPVERLRVIVSFLSRENEICKLEDTISNKVKNQMDKSQRDYYLREQMRAIREELGDGENLDAEVEVLRAKLHELNLSEKITKKIDKELDKLAAMPSNSADASVSRTYIEWVLDLPWNASVEDEIDLIHANEILEEDHYGLDKVKERILEYLAVQALAKSEKGPILCLVGPPGVGKTSIAKSIARSVGRKFVHMSLGGVRDEAEIRGHRRTYIGAIPGRVMTEIKECESKNPVFLFDEVDKIGTDFRGDPASALLEVLDPEQNKEFVDHYLEVPFDLSNVMFICTANTTDTIPRPLLDRMEVLEISGYTAEEKLNIAKKYLVPKQIKANGLSTKYISFNISAIKSLINDYTRESGVRGLEKEIANVCRKVARKIVEGEKTKHSINANNIEEYLGKKRYHYDKLLGKNEVGVATGLAWTVVGGETLFIETAVLPGAGKLQLTGQLGDVMQESAKAAISYLRAHSEELGIEEDFYKTKDIHVHIPEGAVPKDGPSAGITMCMSVLSALTGRRLRKEVAMTGEITLRGKVLAVGGIKEKVLAAHRMGIKKVLLPEECSKDLEELPESVRNDLKFVLISEVSDAIREALI
ncbi:MAG: endopeptidase La [Bacillota bacterium]|nr:endopeptidase La [Bacillota bacterium]